jgi:SEC-C motif
LCNKTEVSKLPGLLLGIQRGELHIPAFCDTCGAIFPSAIAVADGVKNLTLTGIGAGPCPVCGGAGHIPDGVFSFVGNAIEILSAPQRTIDELSHLAKILRQARKKKEAPEAVAQKIRDELPDLAGLADLLPRTRTELYAFLALIIAVIALVSQSCGGPNTTPNITVNQTINQVFIETERSARLRPKQEQSTRRKIGRNDPCPCGSGKKYKKCCGRVQ